MHYRRFIFIGFLMVLFGFIVPFLMVIKVIPASYFWGFLSYGISVVGLFLGLIGGSQYIQVNRRRRDQDSEYEDYYKFKK